MDQGLIPRRYARALYKVALERHCDESLYTMMKTLRESFADNSSLQRVMENPYVAADEKISLLLTAAGVDKTADKSSVDTLGDFIKLLLRNRRIEFARGTAIAYIDIYRQAHDIHTVTVTSASPLDADASRRLLDIVKGHRPDGVFEYSEAVDPQLIGGFTVAVDNERLDASVLNELKQLRLQLVPNR